MPSPIAYVREYEARSRGSYVSNMVHPSRHPDLRIRAHYWAGEVSKASAVLAGLGRDPSHEADIASDRLDECLTAFRETVTDWRTSHRLDTKSLQPHSTSTRELEQVL